MMFFRMQFMNMNNEIVCEHWTSEHLVEKLHNYTYFFFM